MLIPTDSSGNDSSSDGSTIPIIVGITGGIFTLVFMTLFVVIIYFKCLQRKYPHADVTESSLHESKSSMPGA